MPRLFYSLGKCLWYQMDLKMGVSHCQSAHGDRWLCASCCVCTWQQKVWCVIHQLHDDEMLGVSHSQSVLAGQQANTSWCQSLHCNRGNFLCPVEIGLFLYSHSTIVQTQNKNIMWQYTTLQQLQIAATCCGYPTVTIIKLYSRST